MQPQPLPPDPEDDEDSSEILTDYDDNNNMDNDEDEDVGSNFTDEQIIAEVNNMEEEGRAINPDELDDTVDSNIDNFDDTSDFDYLKLPNITKKDDPDE